MRCEEAAQAQREWKHVVEQLMTNRGDWVYGCAMTMNTPAIGGNQKIGGFFEAHQKAEIVFSQRQPNIAVGKMMMGDTRLPEAAHLILLPG